MPQTDLNDCVEYGVFSVDLAKFQIEGIDVQDDDDEYFDGRPVYYVRGEIVPAGTADGRQNVQLIVTFFDVMDRVVAHEIEEVAIDDLGVPEAFDVLTRSCSKKISRIRLMLR